uniref:Uncharacterized protein n=1 Tax=Serinus canaria TaxID=9135 RepID=A0A8C9MUH4_SERCA
LPHTSESLSRAQPQTGPIQTHTKSPGPLKDVLHQLPMKARSTAKGIDPQNDLTCFRIRSKKHKIMYKPNACFKSYFLLIHLNRCT